jgi:hypothetical protein
MISSLPRMNEVGKKTASPDFTSASDPSKSIPSAKLA